MKIKIIFFIAILSLFASVAHTQQTRQIIAKKVPISIEISHDIEPAYDAPAPKVTLTDKIAGKEYQITPGTEVKPGQYYLSISQKGYNFGQPKLVTIPLGEQFRINTSLVAMPNNTDWPLIQDPKTKTFAIPYEISIFDAVTQRPIAFSDPLPPGSKIYHIIKFRQFKTVKKHTVVSKSGAIDPFDISLVPLKQYDLLIKEKGLTLDGIKYRCRFYVDQEPVEEHLSWLQRDSHGYRVTLSALPGAREFQIKAGYLYYRGDLRSLQQPRDFEYIDSAALLRHLQLIGEENSVITILARLLHAKDAEKKFSRCKPEKIETLIQLINRQPTKSRQEYHKKLEIQATLKRYK